MATNDIQLRGHCPCCGRQQAVQLGKMSKHGYTVDNGWFNGVCHGNRHKPVEHEREVADVMIATVRKDCEMLDKYAADLESSKKHPAKCRTNQYDRTTREYVMVAWSDAADYQRENQIKREAAAARYRADSGRSFAAFLEGIVTEFYGKPLVEVTKPEPAARIQPGEQRKDASGRVLVVHYVDGPRVYWKSTDGRKGWTGTRAFRMLEVVAS